MVTLATTYDFSKATMRGGSNTIDTTTNQVKQSEGLPIDYAFGWSYGQAETFSCLFQMFTVAAIKLSWVPIHTWRKRQSAKVYLMTRLRNSPPNSLLTGDQPFTSGPVYLGAAMCFLFIFGLVYLNNKHKWWIAIICLLAILMAWAKLFFFGLQYFPV